MIKTGVMIAPKAVELTYSKELSRLVQQMIKEAAVLLNIYKKKDYQLSMDDNSWLVTDIQKKLDKLGKIWQDRFNEYAESHTGKMLDKILKLSNLQIKNLLKQYYADEKFELLGKVIPNQLRQVVNALIAENVSLIKSIPAQYLERIQGAISRAISGSAPFGQLRRQIVKYGQMSERRAKLIAGDQVRKAFTSINVQKFNQLGIQKVQWVHTGAGKTYRDYHHRMWDGVSGIEDGRPNGLNGFIFDIDKPPVIQHAKGSQLEVRGYPNQLPFCHCRLRPIIDS